MSVPRRVGTRVDAGRRSKLIATTPDADKANFADLMERSRLLMVAYVQLEHVESVHPTAAHHSPHERLGLEVDASARSRAHSRMATGSTGILASRRGRSASAQCAAHELGNRMLKPIGWATHGNPTTTRAGGCRFP
jgi:hypothetical protein